MRVQGHRSSGTASSGMLGLHPSQVLPCNTALRQLHHNGSGSRAATNPRPGWRRLAQPHTHRHKVQVLAARAAHQHHALGVRRPAGRVMSYDGLYGRRGEGNEGARTNTRAVVQTLALAALAQCVVRPRLHFANICWRPGLCLPLHGHASVTDGLAPRFVK